MKREASSRRGDMKSRRSRPFCGFLGGYPGIYQEPRGRFGEAEDEEGKEFRDTEVEAAWEDSPKDPEAPSLALFNETNFSKAEPSLHKMMVQMNQ
ncbi:hypothetical protein O181_060769 [Austropuccinia psidii MF-1]|uniref:Uncharacterized protein n=1 Tax=Austropuccinia psidii MF-1 TaxID=1389203 RepID=A0A9Q3EGW0_9BASI|nr:hypothetical protein [Austropuccinia psidii MF-1]